MFDKQFNRNAKTSVVCQFTFSLHLTTLCLQYKPTVVSCVCVELACKWSNWEVSSLMSFYTRCPAFYINLCNGAFVTLVLRCVLYLVYVIHELLYLWNSDYCHSYLYGCWKLFHLCLSLYTTGLNQIATYSL